MRALTTPRLWGERPAEEHLPFLEAMWQDPGVTATLGGPRSPAQVRAGLDRWWQRWEEDGFGLCVFRLRTTGELVGWGGVQRSVVAGEDVAEIGYAIAAAHWGTGLATEIACAAVRQGFDDLGLDEMVALTLPTNRASQRVMEKAGLTYERDVEHAGLPHVLYRIRRCPS